IAFVRGPETQLLPMNGTRAAGPVESIPPPGPGLSFAPRAFSPDGRQLLGFVKRSAEIAQEQWAAYTISSQSYETSKLPAPTRPPVVMPLRDGNLVAASTDERHGIDLVDTRSGESRPLLPPSRAQYIQSWAISPDEKFLFINRATEQ